MQYIGVSGGDKIEIIMAIIMVFRGIFTRKENLKKNGGRPQQKGQGWARI